MGGDDATGFNSGLMVLQRSLLTRKMLAGVMAAYLSEGGTKNCCWDQQAMQRLYRNNKWAQRALCIVPHRPLQSFVKAGEYRAGDFSAHFTATMDTPDGRKAAAGLLATWNRSHMVEEMIH